MVAIVIGVNGLLAIVLLWLTIQAWQWRKLLGTIADALEASERSTHALLSHAPPSILIGQTGTAALRQSLRNLDPQFQRLAAMVARVDGLLTWLGQQQRGRQQRRSGLGSSAGSNRR